MKHEDLDKSRRSFLRGAVATGVAAGAATASLDVVADIAPAAGDKADQKTGYQLTGHVKAYYESLTR